MSASSPVLAWLDAPRGDRGIRFAREDEGWDERTYEELAAAVHAAGHRIAEAAGPEQVVGLVIATGPEFVAAFYGALVAGKTPSPIRPPSAFEDVGAYRDHVARVLHTGRAGLVVTTDDLATPVAAATRHAGMARPPLVLGADARDAGPLREPAADLALLQFTSGSSGSPKGARVTWSNLESALALTAAWYRVDDDLHMARWLPLHHDMGLIAGLLMSVAAQIRLSFLRPDQFIRRPGRWLECLGGGGANATASPSFGYAYAARRADPARDAHLDFSGWRSAGIGADRIGIAPLLTFLERFGSRGFEPTMFTTGYGMAEATLQATGSRHGELLSAVRLGAEGVRFGAAVEGERRTVLEAGEHADPGAWLVSSGAALGDFDVRIVGEDGARLDERHLGEIVLRGTAVVDGYEGDGSTGLTRFEPDGALHTGDAGFLADGELYVLGRMGDAISTRGRSIYVEDVEARLGHVPGVPPGRFVVLAGGDRVVAIVESEPGPWVPAVRAALVRHCGTDVDVAVRSAARGTIRRTSSGKPQRRRMWQDLVEGRMPGEDAA